MNAVSEMTSKNYYFCKFFGERKTENEKVNQLKMKATVKMRLGMIIGAVLFF